MTDTDAGHLEHVATFRCHTCDAVAGSVMLIRGATGLWRTQHTGGYTVVVTDALGQISGWYDDAAIDPIRAALQAHDARDLFAINNEFTRFYCSTCDRWYCRNHQTIDVRFDDDYPGWYDATYATCPQGHHRMIDD